MTDLKRNLICLRFRSDFFFTKISFKYLYFPSWAKKLILTTCGFCGIIQLNHTKFFTRT